MTRKLAALFCLLAAILCDRTQAQTTQPANTPAYLQEAFQAVNTLQGWYQPSTGLYQTTGYWNAANSITVLANYSRLDNTSAFFPVFANTLAVVPRSYPNFLDGYYDDEGWWALAWIDVYDLTHQPQYLAAAQRLYTDMQGAWDNTCGGGIWWNSDRQYKNAIANELFLSVASELAARAANGTDRANYLSWAEREWAWFQASGMINSENLINDGLDTNTCKNNGQKTWSYNQGVILGGLTQLNALTQNASLLTTAQTIASSAIAHLTTSTGILTDTCEPNCGNDGVEFKGVFLRNLMALQAVVQQPAYTTFIRTNANSIWNNARGPNYQLGQAWTGPFDAGNAGSQNSGLDAILAAASTLNTTASGAPAPSFSLSASPSSLSPTPGVPVSSTITITPDSGFSGPVHLNSVVVGGPVGVTHTLSESTLNTEGTTTFTLTTSPSTPGGTYLVAVTGSSGSLSKVTYITLNLPNFALSPATSSLYLDQASTLSDTITVNPSNGFSDYVNLAATGLPFGVTATFSPESTATTTDLTLTANAFTPTTSGTAFSVSAHSGPTEHQAPSFALAISAALSSCGSGTPLDLSPYFNLTALHTNGTPYTDGGLDGLGNSLSANLVGPARTLNNILFTLGKPNQPNGVFFAGQSIAGIPGTFTQLHLLATGINGRQPNQTITVIYTDGSVTNLFQSFADWYGADLNINETEAVAMPYRLASNGMSAGNTPFNLYGYTFNIDPTRTIARIILPTDRNVVLLAATLSRTGIDDLIDLRSAFNRNGIVADGTTFPANGGVDGLGNAFSANLLNDGTGGVNFQAGPVNFYIAPAVGLNAAAAAGEFVPVSEFDVRPYKTLALLGTAVNGNQLNQPITIHYDDGTSHTVYQNFSDWYSIGNFQNEVLAIRTPYRDSSNGSTGNTPFNLYLYTYPLSLSKNITGITLPNNPNVVLFGASLLSALNEQSSCKP